MSVDDVYPFSVPAAAVRPPQDAEGAERAYAANLVGSLARAVADRLEAGARTEVGRGAHAPAALVTLLWYPDRPIGFLATRLRISHPGAVQLAQRLAADGLVERIPGEDGRTTLLALTAAGEAAALAVLARRREVVGGAVDALDPDQVPGVIEALEAMLAALTGPHGPGDRFPGETICRLCDELACPDERCPVERAEPTPPSRRGLGYGARPAPSTPPP